MENQSQTPRFSPPPADVEAITEIPTTPACMVCGRQDETLRIVGLPYVFSILVVTFRRAFVGLWCRRHRTLRLTLAGTITSFFGWIGVPYGLVFAPVALFKLAKGGDMPVDANAKMLKNLADHKLKSGDVQGAVRCMEAVLRLAEDDEEAKQRLSELYRKFSSSANGAESSFVFPTLVAILGAIVIGATIGILEFLTGKVFSSFLPGEVDIVGVILSWVPFVGTVLLGGILLVQCLEWVFVRFGVRGRGFGTGLAILTTVLAVYAIPSGLVLSEFVEALLSTLNFTSLTDALMTTGAVVTRGGAWIISDAARNGATADVIFLFVLIVALGFYTVSNVSIATSVVRWKQRLGILRPQTVGEGAPFSGYGLAMLLCVTLVIAVLFGGFMNVPRLTRTLNETWDLIARGDELYARGDIEGAERAYEEAAATNPDDVWSRVYLGWTYYSQGKLNQAKWTFAEVLRIDPGLVEAHLGYGFTMVPLGEYEKAVEHFEFVVQRTSDPALQSQAYYGLGDAYFALEDFDRAIQNAQQGITLEPTNAYLHLKLAWYYFNADDLENALDAYDETFRLDPTLSEAIFGRGLVYLYQEDHERAIDEFQRVIEMGAEESVLASAHLGLGRSYSSMGDLPEAIVQFEQILALEPDDMIARAEIILAYILQGEYDVALEQVDQLIDLHPSSAIGYALKASVCFQLDQLELMEEMLEEAYALRGRDEVDLSLLAFALTGMQRFAESESILLEAREVSTDQETVLIHLAQVYSSQRKFDQARATMDELLALAGESDDFYLMQASIAIEQVDFDQAQNLLERATEMDPDAWQVHNGLSYVYFQQGRIAEALSEAQEALRLYPYSSGNYKNLAFAHHALGDLELALEAAKESVRLEPKYDLAHYILGLCYLDMGELEKARIALEEFLDLYWDRANVSEYKEQAEAYLEQLR